MTEDYGYNKIGLWWNYRNVLLCYEILSQYQNGEITRPNTSYVLERLPHLEWN